MNRSDPITTQECSVALERFILSASGWRTVFAPTGQDEDASPAVSAAHRVLAGLMAQTFAEALPGLAGSKASFTLALGSDTRPTGPAIMDAMLPALAAAGCTVRLVGVSAAPEIMAWAREAGDIDGFIYVSASHNPIGHNGVKFGLRTGGVLTGPQIKPLIERFKVLAADQTALDAMAGLQRNFAPDELARIKSERPAHKRAALDAYRAFSGQVLADSSDPAGVGRAISQLAAAVRNRSIGIVGDLNGSARADSIDRDFLAGLGVKTRFINDVPGKVAHRIVPEGESLDWCRAALAEAHAEDPDFVLGYMPDNDGDRGNLVYVDGRDGTVKALEAQEVFALCCLAEMAYLVASGKLRYDASGKPTVKAAIAVNDPTSLRIEELAAVFGVEVHRAEVGEANVVSLAEELRARGYLVRILGEGSNGGNITHPAAVRDPLNTIASFLKLLTMTGGDVPDLFGIWCQRRGVARPAAFGLAEVIESLPRWTTTSAYEDRAILRISSTDHARLKNAYEEVFRRDWNHMSAELRERFGIVSWEERNYEGTREIVGCGPQFRTGAARGGFRILFRDARDAVVAVIWMRGSGTEPVFRVAADCRGGDPAVEAWFLDWHKNLIARADA